MYYKLPFTQVNSRQNVVCYSIKCSLGKVLEFYWNHKSCK